VKEGGPVEISLRRGKNGSVLLWHQERKGEVE